MSGERAALTTTPSFSSTKRVNLGMTVAPPGSSALHRQCKDVYTDHQDRREILRCCPDGRPEQLKSSGIAIRRALSGSLLRVPDYPVPPSISSDISLTVHMGLPIASLCQSGVQYVLRGFRCVESSVYIPANVWEIRLL